MSFMPAADFQTRKIRSHVTSTDFRAQETFARSIRHEVSTGVYCLFVSYNDVLIDVHRQEALEAAISEKDAHLALLEMSGIRTERQACEVDQLRKDKRRLMERLRREVNTMRSR